MGIRRSTYKSKAFDQEFDNYRNLWKKFNKFCGWLILWLFQHTNLSMGTYNGKLAFVFRKKFQFLKRRRYFKCVP